MYFRTDPPHEARAPGAGSNWQRWCREHCVLLLAVVLLVYSGLLFPAEDLWVFDGQVVLWNHFAGDSSWVGEERADDPAVAKICVSSFDAAWERGVPHEDYQPA